MLTFFLTVESWSSFFALFFTFGVFESVSSSITFNALTVLIFSAISLLCLQLLPLGTIGPGSPCKLNTRLYTMSANTIYRFHIFWHKRLP